MDGCSGVGPAEFHSFADMPETDDSIGYGRADVGSHYHGDGDNYRQTASNKANNN